MELRNMATRIHLFDFKSVQTRAFHLTWLAFHLCFFGWFGIAPLMAVVREDLGLSKSEIGSTIIASVAITVLVRLVLGPLCDKIGPRKAYTWLLCLGSIPVMYAPNCVGTANATTAGWRNLGGGTTQIVMPLIFAGVMMLGVNEFLGWRIAMVVPGIMLFAVGIAYYVFTQDAPDGNYDELRAEGIALMVFSQMTVLAVAVLTLVIFSLFTQMAEGATYGIVPFMNKKALGAVAGIVGAGGNAGAVAAGFLFKAESLSYEQGLLYLGIAVTATAFFSFAVRCSTETIDEEDAALRTAIRERDGTAAANEGAPVTA